MDFNVAIGLYRERKRLAVTSYKDIFFLLLRNHSSIIACFSLLFNKRTATLLLFLDFFTFGVYNFEHGILFCTEI